MDWRVGRMTVVVRLEPLPRWWMWRPGVDRGAALAVAVRRARWGRARLLAAAAVPLGGVLAALAPAVGRAAGRAPSDGWAAWWAPSDGWAAGWTTWWAVGLGCLPLVCAVGVGLVLPRRVSEWELVVLAAERDVVHFEQFADPVQRRRARRLCEDFLALGGGGGGQGGEGAGSPWLRGVEVLLWRALVALRDSLVVREALSRADNRPGLAAEIAESARALAELDRRVDEFASALRIAVEDVAEAVDGAEVAGAVGGARTVDGPRVGMAGSALRRLAALDPIESPAP